jgi:gliding motility-associated-like protein
MRIRILILFLCLVQFVQGQYFTENKGQIAQQHVLFDLSLSTSNVYFEKNGLTFQLLEKDPHDEKTHKHVSTSRKAHVIRQKFIQSQYSGIRKGNTTESYYNFIKGNDPSQWVSGVKKYEEIEYTEIYPKINIRYYNKDDQFKYDIIVKPGGDVAHVQFEYEGADRVRIAQNGDLEIETSLGKIIEKAPFTYQNIQGQVIPVKTTFKKQGNRIVFDVLDAYDHSQELIIDPLVVFSTFTGSTGDNWGFTATYDNQGNMFTGGIVFGSGYPTTSGAYNTSFNGGEIDMAISKFNASGSQLIYSTYIGGNEPDAPHSMIVDDQNQLIILGTTSSYDYPTSTGCYDGSYNGGTNYIMDGIQYQNGSDIVITKLNAAGSALVASTYYGGSNNDGLNRESSANKLHHNYADNARGEVMIDPAGNIYIASCTESINLPTTSGVVSQSFRGGTLDGCAAKFNPSLSSLAWSTFLGGSSNDAAYSIKTASNGNVYIAGGTMSTNFTTTSGVINPTFKGGDVDGFLTGLSSSTGSLVASTFIGTSSYDQSYFIELDALNNVYVMGQTKGNYPISGAGYSNPGSPQFIHKLNPSLSTTIFSTVFGNGNNQEVNISPSAFLVDKCNKIYVAGWGGSLCAPGSTTSGMPVTANANQSTTDGADFYFMVLDDDASGLLYGSFFGGNGQYEHVDGGTSRFDKNGYIYQAVCAGCGGSNQFPTTPGVWSNDNNSYNCNLGAIKIRFDQTPVYTNATVLPDTFSCVVPFVANFSNTSINATSHYWQFGVGQGSSTSPNPNYTYTTPGLYEIMYVASNPNACNLHDTTYLHVTIVPVTPPLADFTYTVQCANRVVSVQSTGTSGYTLSWDMGDGTTYGNVQNLTHTYAQPGYYDITIVNQNTLCQVSGTKTMTIYIKPMFDAVLTSSDPTICIPSMSQFQSNVGAQNYFWNFGDGQISSGVISSAQHTYLQEGVFSVEVLVTDSNFCNVRDSATVSIQTSDGSAIIADFLALKNCTNQSVSLQNTSQGLSSFTTSFWTFGDSTSQYSSNTTLNHVYGAYGLYEITLWVEDTICNLSDTSVKIIKMDLVTVETTPAPSYGCRPFFTTFTTVSNGIQYQWNFDDGSSGAIQNPSHTFLNGGVYQVTVTAIDSNTCNFSAQDVVTISVGSGIPLIADFDVVQDPNCDIQKVHVTNQSAGEISGYTWDFGDASPPQHTISPSHIYPEPGTYTITLSIEDTLCSFNDQISQDVFLKPPIVFSLPAQKFICFADTLYFDTKLDPSLYQHLWSNGSINSSITVDVSGIYSVTVTDGLCIKSREVQVIDPPRHDLGDTLQQCYLSETMTLDIGIEALEYLWYKGQETSKNIQTEEAGFYPFYVKDLYECEYVDTFLLLGASSVNNVYVPNTFTPNGDGLNDQLYSVGEGIESFEFTLFNRWGSILFQSRDLKNGWDGSYEGSLVQEGIYSYKVKYHNKCATENEVIKHGFVLVLR